ncbi:MAG: DUF2490 domain-containing protein [Hyphomonas sp.]
MFLSLLALTAHAKACATDDGLEFWVNPSASFTVDGDREFEIETAQRLRNASDGRADTYFGRLWLHQKLATGATVSGAVERRVNDGGTDEKRLMQQVSTRHGVVKTRFRLEQRFVDGAERAGLRLRPRIGVAIPLGDEGRWSFRSDAELFLTLQSTSRTGDEGLTGLRTQIGFGYELSDRVSLSAGYLRQQDIVAGRPDTVGHAPIIAIDYAF